jgi:hypothetical protein
MLCKDAHPPKRGKIPPCKRDAPGHEKGYPRQRAAASLPRKPAHHQAAGRARRGPGREHSRPPDRLLLLERVATCDEECFAE